VEYVDNNLAKVYMNSATAQRDFADMPFMLRQAISLARRLQDPLIEFCQAFNDDDDLLCLSLHVAQDMVCVCVRLRTCAVQIPRDELVCSLERQFMDRVNEVGVDINRCLEQPHASNTLRFVAGLGPCKAAHLLKTLKLKNNNMMEARYQLVKRCGMGPVVFMNCAGFIKIDTARVIDKTDMNIETLDSTRIHPEAYHFARKIATDALDDGVNQQSSPIYSASAFEEVLEQPEKLHNLDLNAFAIELKRQGLGDKMATLIDLRAELLNHFVDRRVEFVSPINIDLFHMLTNESPATFAVNRVVLVRVMFVLREKPPLTFAGGGGDDDGQTNAVLEPTCEVIDKVKWYTCPRCHKGGYDDLARMWNHMDTWNKGIVGHDPCPGKARGVMCLLENGLVGYIRLDELSDEAENIRDPLQKVSVCRVEILASLNYLQSNQSIYCRVLDIDFDRMSCKLTCKTSSMADDVFK
jgi:transcription elongation factor SPT6